MRKTLAFALSIGVIATSLTTSAFGAVKSGSSCTKAGKNTTSSGKTFTCIKSGKKLVWNKGVPIRIDTGPSSAPTPSPSPKETEVAEFDEVEPTAPTGQVTFDNLMANYAGVSYWAWKKSSTKIEKSKPSETKFTILKGPNTVPINENPSLGVTLASRMYSDFPQANEYVVIYYNYKDIAWAEKYVTQYIGTDGGYDTSGEVKKMCPSADRCNAAAAMLNQKTLTGVTIITSSDSMRNDPNFYSGTLEAHEYSHTIQSKQINGKLPSNRIPPRWLTEGGAEFIQTASVHYKSFSQYQKDRQRITRDLYSGRTFNERWLNSFLNPSSVGVSWENWNQYDGWRVYDVGFMVSEILVAIAGPESIMEIYRSMGSGLSYQEAFQKIFGVSWETGIQTINKTLDRQIG